MATQDNNLQVINSMTQEIMNSLKNSEGKIPDLANQLIMTDEEDIYLSQIRISVLWTNLNPTSAFSAQTITLKSSDYDYLLFISDLYQSSSVSAQRNTVSMTIKGRGCSLNAAADYGSNEATFYRTATYINDTQYNISGGSYRSNTTTGNSDNILVPIQVIGLKKQPAMIYTGKEILEGDGINIDGNKISTVSSFDSQTLLYGTAEATSGITSGTVTLGDITPYKFLVFVSGQGSYKTINTYNVRSLTNGELGLYGYASQYINITISGSLTAFKITLIASASQSLWRIWGVK